MHLRLKRAAAEKYHLEPVAVVPVRTAGGSMSAYAYTKMKDPVVVEHVQAHAGIDIGQTLIGMHLKIVAVPIRTSVKKIGRSDCYSRNNTSKINRWRTRSICSMHYNRSNRSRVTG